MPNIDFVNAIEIVRTARVQQLEAMFDVPPTQKCRIEYRGELPIEDAPWNIGVIVGPSGCGKTSIMRQIFGEPAVLDWKASSVIDDFPPELSIETIATICSSVGFNTIPAWMRPFAVLSNGEKFRAEMARRICEGADPIVIDEFSSVVDRQVAQIGAYAVQKLVRRNDRKFIAITCHYDVIEWLQPDWMFEPATMTFTRRLLQRRPQLDLTISRVHYTAWRMFAPYHYLTANLHQSSRCFVLFVKDQPAAFAAMMRRPHPKVKNIMGCSRLVTLPDWQGLGLAFILIDTIGAAYKTLGERVRTYPAHPALIRNMDKSSKWSMRKPPGVFSQKPINATSLQFGNRPCAVFEYAGDAMIDVEQARCLIHPNDNGAVN